MFQAGPTISETRPVATTTGQNPKTADSPTSILSAPNQSTSNSKKINAFIARNNPIETLPSAKDLHKNDTLQSVPHENRRSITEIKALPESRYKSETLFTKVKSPPKEIFPSISYEQPLQYYEPIEVNKSEENRIISPKKVTRQKTESFNKTCEDLASSRNTDIFENDKNIITYSIHGDRNYPWKTRMLDMVKRMND